MQGSGGTQKATLHASLHEDRASLLLEELRQHPLSKLWQGPGARGPEYRSWITLYHMMEVSGGLSTHINPQCRQSRSLAHTTSAAQGYGTAAATALGPSPVLAQQAVLWIHSLPQHHQALLPCGAALPAVRRHKAPLASPPCFQVTAGVAAKPPPWRGPHHTAV